MKAEIVPTLFKEILKESREQEAASADRLNRCQADIGRIEDHLRNAKQFVIHAIEHQCQIKEKLRVLSELVDCEPDDSGVFTDKIERLVSEETEADKKLTDARQTQGNWERKLDEAKISLAGAEKDHLSVQRKTAAALKRIGTSACA
jgi:hypothetical protein